MVITTESGLNSLKDILTEQFLTKVAIFRCFSVLMYALYGHPRYFKFKRKYQQYGPCFQTIFPFLMTMFKFAKIKQVLRDAEVISYLSILQEQYVMCPIEKAANSIAFICKK